MQNEVDKMRYMAGISPRDGQRQEWQNMSDETEAEDQHEQDCQEDEGVSDQDDFTERLRRTLYYGKMPENDCPSLAMTEIAVEVIQKAAPRELGRVDMQWAASVGRRACVSPCSLMLGLLYIERLRYKNPEYLQKISSSELFLVSMMVASKYLYDEGIEEEVFNDEWAESARIDTSDINLLERNFLTAIEWSLFTDHSDFESMLNAMEHRIACSRGQDRGWLTYTDLLVLCRDQQLLQHMRELLQEVGKVMVVCSMAYIAGSLTMLSSVMALQVIHTHLTPVGPTTWPSLPVTEDSLVSRVPPTIPQLKQDVWRNIADDQLMNELCETELEHLVPNCPAPGVIEPVKQAEKSFEFSGTRLMAFPVQGLLTLALIKDTLVKFALGVNEKFGPGEWVGHNGTGDTTSENGLEMRDHPRSGPCNCPNCPLKSQGSNHSLFGGQILSYWLDMAQATRLKMQTPLLSFEKGMGGNGQAASELCPHGASGLPDCAGPPRQSCQPPYCTYHVVSTFPDVANRHHTAGQIIVQ